MSQNDWWREAPVFWIMTNYNLDFTKSVASETLHLSLMMNSWIRKYAFNQYFRVEILRNAVYGNT